MRDNEFSYDENTGEATTLLNMLFEMLSKNGHGEMLSDLNQTLKEYRLTNRYFNQHITGFEAKSVSALDKQFLIQAELERFKQYVDPETLKNKYETDYSARGFFWAMTGENYRVIDFFYFVGDTRQHLYAIEDDKLPKNELLERWQHIPQYIDRASLGYSYALYVKYLQGLTVNECNTTPETITDPNCAGRGLSAKAKILMLEKIDFFNLPMITNCNAETLAPIVAAIIGNGLNVDNIGNAISSRHGLEQFLRQGKRKKELEQVNNLLASIGSELKQT